MIQPPRGGPITGDTTTAMPQMAKAVPRLAGGKLSASMVCESGTIPAPPSPSTTRQKIRADMLVAIPQNRFAAANRMMQEMKKVLRPRISASHPLSGRMTDMATR